MKKPIAIVVKFLKGIGWAMVVLLSILLLAIILIRLPVVQEKLTQKAITYLNDKIGTRVRLDQLYVSFPKTVVLKGFLVEDQTADTLVYFHELAIDTDLWGLTKNEINLNEITLQRAVVKVDRTENDSTFNFDYIIRAFSENARDEKEPSTPWDFTIGEIVLEDIRARYSDDFGGIQATAQLGDVKVSLEVADFAKNTFKFKTINLANCTGDLILSAGQSNTVSNQDSVNKSPVLGFDKIDFTAINFDFHDNINNTNVSSRIGEFQIDANWINLSKSQIDINKILLSNSFVAYHSAGDSSRVQSKAGNQEDAGFSWDIRVDELTLSENGIQFENFGMPVVKKGFDSNHFWIHSMNVQANSIILKENDYQADIKEISLQEKKGFDLQMFRVRAIANKSEIIVSDFLLQTKNSLLEFDATTRFQEHPSNPGDTTVTMDLRDSHLSMSDVTYFVPTLMDGIPLKLAADNKIFADGKIKGSLENLDIDHLQISTLDSTNINLSGTVKNVNDPERIFLDVQLSEFHTTRPDIMQLVADTLIPQSVQLPEWVSISGNMVGLLKNSSANIQLVSDLGIVSARGKYDLTSIPRYNFNINTEQLQLGRILQQESIGALHLEARVEGTGTSFDNIDAKIESHIHSLEYNHYAYRDLKISGTMRDYFFSGEALLKDKNLDFELDADLDYKNTIPTYRVEFNLNNVDLNALHLSERTLKARATLEAKLTTSDFRIMNGNMAIRNVAVSDGESLYKIDSLIFVSLDQEGISELEIQSDIVEGEFNGSFSLVDLPKTLKQHLHQYFTLPDSSVKAFTSRQQFTFGLTIKNTDMLTKILLPDLKSFVPGKIEGEFDSEKGILDLHVDIAKTQYAAVHIESFNVDIDSNPQALNYKVLIKDAGVDTLTINEIQWNGKLANDLLETNFSILDSIAQEKYAFAANVNSIPGGLKIHLLPDRLLLNYSGWDIPDDNAIAFTGNTFSTTHFTLSKAQQKLGIISDAEQSNLKFRFTGFELANLTNIVSGVIPASGIISGVVQIANDQTGKYSSDLTIHKFNFLEEEWGDLNLEQKFAEQVHTIMLSVVGGKSNIRATGKITTSTEPGYDINIDLSPLDLSILEPIVMAQARNLKGNVSGRLQLRSRLKKPVISGTLAFTDTKFTSTYLNSSFELQDERISFSESGIHFDSFIIRDEKENKATLRGNILTNDYSDLGFSLQFSANNFQLLNTTEEDNDLFYGTLAADLRANINGTIAEPKIEVSAKVKSESEVTYIIPESKSNVAEREGVIKFVDHDVDKDPFLSGLSDSDTVRTKFTGLNLTVNLDLDDKTLLNIVLDPRTSDRLSVNGNASLVVDMDPSGRLDLTGRYQITKGTYNFSFQNLAKRQFEIQNGSSLLWSGDPLNAEVDIRALYEVETSPLDLIVNQTTTTDKTQLNSYRQRLPFLVYLIMKGRILEPDISFRLDMPEDKRSAFSGAIYAKLQDINTRESDLNKQVFALLILKRFISDNPFESQAAGSFSNTARQSVSRLLSDQLNRLSENIKGIELNFDIKSYENYTGDEVQGETRAQLGVSKDLFNERLVVKLSGNVNLEGQEKQTEVTDYIGDIALEYKLTNDGRIRITGFRTSDFDMIDGELTETGAGIIYIKDYDTLRELFRRNKKK